MPRPFQRPAAKDFVRVPVRVEDPEFLWYWVARFLAQHLVTKNAGDIGALIRLYDSGNGDGTSADVYRATARVLREVSAEKAQGR